MNRCQNPRKVTDAQIVRSCRMYHTDTLAAKALGISTRQLKRRSELLEITLPSCR